MKKFKIEFVGRARNSIGSFAIQKLVVFAETKEAAILEMGKEWESNAILSVENCWVS